MMTIYIKKLSVSGTRFVDSFEAEAVVVHISFEAYMHADDHL
jgi:hypothetical protein